jgi:hypothetical protein
MMRTTDGGFDNASDILPAIDNLRKASGEIVRYMFRLILYPSCALAREQETTQKELLFTEDLFHSMFFKGSYWM